MAIQVGQPTKTVTPINADADIDNKLNGILDITFAPDDPEQDPPAVSGEAILRFGSDIYTQYFNWTTSFEIAFKIVGETPQSNASVGMYLRYNTSAPSPYIAMYANAVSGTGLTCKGYNQPAIGVTVVGPSIELNKSVIMTCIPSYSDGIPFNKKLSFFVNGILIGEITNQDNIPDTDELLALSILIRVNALNAIELDYVKLWTPRPPNAP